LSNEKCARQSNSEEVSNAIADCGHDSDAGFSGSDTILGPMMRGRDPVEKKAVLGLSKGKLLRKLDVRTRSLIEGNVQERREC
jgi:hypothetical protein